MGSRTLDAASNSRFKPLCECRRQTAEHNRVTHWSGFVCVAGNPGTPDFLWNLVALALFLGLSLRRAEVRL
jgi:hypothetical protein